VKRWSSPEELGVRPETLCGIAKLTKREAIDARRKKASTLQLRFCESLANLRARLNEMLPDGQSDRERNADVAQNGRSLPFALIVSTLEVHPPRSTVSSTARHANLLAGSSLSTGSG
jgi:hypothetical protein